MTEERQMSDVRLVTEGKHELKPLVQAALANELRLIEAGIKQTQKRLESFENQYGMSTQDFISGYERDDREEVLELAEWIGESRLLARLREKAEVLRDIRIEN
jgi:hypothetical protein